MEPNVDPGGGDTKVCAGGGGNLKWEVPPLVDAAEGVAAREKLDLGLSACAFPSFVGVKLPRRSNWLGILDVPGGGKGGGSRGGSGSNRLESR